MFAEVAIEHGTALAFSFLANSTIFTLWVAFLVVEIFSFFNNHVTTLDNGTQEGVHFELKNDEVGALVRGNHLLWKFDLNGLVSNLSAAGEEVALHTNWRDWQVRLGIVADLNGAVTLLGNSLSTPLNIVLRALGSQEMGLRVSVSTAVLSLGWVSGLRNINKLSSSWLQKLCDRSELFDFLDVGRTLLGYSLELVIGKVLRCVQCLVSEVLFGLTISSIVLCFLLLFGDLGSSLLILELVLLVTCH